MSTPKKTNIAKTVNIINRKARHEYALEDTFTAGMVLLGTEIKSIRQGKINFTDSHCTIRNGEAYILNLHISPYTEGNLNNHDPSRERKLLLKKREINKINKKLEVKGYSLIPTRLFINDRGMAKLEIRTGKGKKLYDKREDLKKRDQERNLKSFI